MIAIIPAGAFVDFVSDALVVSVVSNILAGAPKTVGAAFLCSVPLALIQVKRRWTLETPR
jgi:hypothetical protein